MVPVEGFDLFFGKPARKAPRDVLRHILHPRFEGGPFPSVAEVRPMHRKIELGQGVGQPVQPFQPHHPGAGDDAENSIVGGPALTAVFDSETKEPGPVRGFGMVSDEIIETVLRDENGRGQFLEIAVTEGEVASVVFSVRIEIHPVKAGGHRAGCLQKGQTPGEAVRPIEIQHRTFAAFFQQGLEVAVGEGGPNERRGFHPAPESPARTTEQLAEKRQDGGGVGAAPPELNATGSIGENGLHDPGLLGNRAQPVVGIAPGGNKNHLFELPGKIGHLAFEERLREAIWIGVGHDDQAFIHKYSSKM
ncbi:MAG: hypothetical protein AAF614_34220 [Chloroflexota bacterium]